MLRRGVGVGALKKREQTQQTYKEMGAKLEENQMQHLHASLSTFRSSLEQFALKYKDEIKSNPLFRAQFHRMCTATGVDPLACHKGFWAQILGLGDFYAELSVQIMDVCLSTRDANGGIIEMAEVLHILQTKHKHQNNITLDDMVQSVSKLSCLGSGFVILPIGGPRNLGRHLLKSVPIEINVDHLALLAMAAGTEGSSSASASGGAGAGAGGPAAAGASTAPKGCIRASGVQRDLGWSGERVSNCVSLLLEEGMVWLDAQGGEATYWFPAMGGL